MRERSYNFAAKCQMAVSQFLYHCRDDFAADPLAGSSYPHETLSGNPTDSGRDARLILSTLAEGKRLTLSSFADAGD